MEKRTHALTNERLCGKATELAPGFARVELDVSPDMCVDERNLVHGGFVFGLADYAAMLAVNEPTVVLGAAEVRFLKPVTCPSQLVAEAKVGEVKGKKQLVSVIVASGNTQVFVGTFTCFVLERHVLDN